VARPRRGWLRRILDYFFVPALLFLLLLVSARLEQVGMVEIAGTIEVKDGDTITVAGERLRLRGIDAPELSQTCSRGGATYSCGRSAREALSRLVAGQTVSCFGRERDRYQRLLATCAAGGVEVNRAMVEQGWALAYGGYRDAEATARGARAGLWAGTFDRPQDWRVQHGGMAEGEHELFDGLWSWLKALFRSS
jgi:endonuclease YncB( thermonuclease family)